MELSIIIVNYNLAKEVEESVGSIIKYCNEIDYEIIILDNNSPDKFIYSVKENLENTACPQITFEFLDENYGFGTACNRGAEKARGEVLLFLNPDTLITGDIFKKIISNLKENPANAITGPYTSNGNFLFDFCAGYYINIIFEVLNIFFIGRHLEALLVSLKKKLKRKQSFKTGWVLGAALFIKKELFYKVGGFDQNFFMFFEEMDLCKRVDRLGYDIIYCPSLELKHQGGASAKKDYRFFTFIFYKSKFIYVKKHFHGLNKYTFIAVLFMQAISQILLWSLFYTFNKEKSAGKIKGFVDFLKILFNNDIEK